MKLRTLQRAFGPNVKVSRDRRTRVVEVAAAGLRYRADETRFASESELAEYARSKMPIANLMPAR